MRDPKNAPIDELHAYMELLSQTAPEEYPHYDEPLFQAIEPLLELYARDIHVTDFVEGTTIGRFARAMAMAVQIGLIRGQMKEKKRKARELPVPQGLDHAVQIVLSELSPIQKAQLAALPYDEMERECRLGLGKWVADLLGLGTDRADMVYRDITRLLSNSI